MGLYGYGELDDYGTYTIVCADSLEEATEIIKKDEFSRFKDKLSDADEYKICEDGGKRRNGYWDKYLHFKEKGYYSMDEKSLYEAFCKNEFGKDMWCLLNPNKPYKVVDLKTNVWHGETA